MKGDKEQGGRRGLEEQGSGVERGEGLLVDAVVAPQCDAGKRTMLDVLNEHETGGAPEVMSEKVRSLSPSRKVYN